MLLKGSWLSAKLHYANLVASTDVADARSLLHIAGQYSFDV